MSVSSSTATLAPPSGNLRAEQLYATHCLKSDSVEGQAGFSVRAISGHAAAWTRFARDFPSLKVPLDMSGTELLPQQAPRRLALVKAPEGKTALIHSSYLPKDTLGRSLNYFTHVLIYARIPPRLALRAWGASSWTTTYPEGASQGLEPFSGVPDGGLINDEALSRFLSDPAAPANQDLATTLYPTRVQGDLERHRRWVRAVLQGFLLAHAQPASGRSRLYILGEPGLVALLTYAVARLLPDSLSDGLTFSTFESSHGSLREFQDAQVIGTYMSNTQRGLEADYLNRRGYGVDTFLNKFSPELSTEGTHPLDRLIAIAARRGWAEIDELLTFWRFGEPSVTGLEEALRVQEPARRLRQSTSWDIADLLTLQAMTLGRELLKGPEFRDQLWPQVRKWSSRPDVIKAFNALFRETAHLADLEAEARSKLATGSLADWKQRWEVIQGILPPDEVAAHFSDILDLVGRGQKTALALSSRIELLRQWQAIEPRREEVPTESAWLLDCAGANDWQALSHAGLPARWVGQALCRALAGNAPDEAALVLQRGDDALIRGFCQALSTDPARDQALTHLLGPQQSAAPDLFQRLWKNGLNLDEPTLDALLVRVNAEAKAWNEFWKADDHMVLVLKRTIPAGPFAQRLWKRCTDRLKIDCLLGDAIHQKYLADLQKALKALDQRVPPEAAEAVNDWTRLAQHLSQPGTTAPDALRAICQRRGIGDPEALWKLMQKPASAPSSTVASRTSGPAVKSRQKLGTGPQSINRALIAAVAVLTIALLALTFVWQNAEQRLKDTKAELIDTKDKLKKGEEEPDSPPVAQTKPIEIAKPTEGSVPSNADAQLKDTKQKLKDVQKNLEEANKKLTTAIRDKAAAEKKAREANEKLAALPAQGNGSSAPTAVAPKSDVPKNTGSASADGDAHREVTDLYRYHIAWANRELLNHKPDGIKIALDTYTKEEERLRQSKPQLFPTSAEDRLWPRDWQWETLSKLSQPKAETLTSDAADIKDMAFIHRPSGLALVWANWNAVSWIDLSGVPGSLSASQVIGKKDVTTKPVSFVLSNESGELFALVKTRAGEFTFWSSQSLSLKPPPFRRDGAIQQFALSATGKRFATALVPSDKSVPGGYIQTWDGEKEWTKPPHFEGKVGALAFSPDGQRLAYGMDNIVKLWLVDKEQDIPINRPYAASTPVSSLAFSPDGQRLAIATEREVEVSFLNEQKEPLLLTYGGKSSDRCVAFSAKRGLLATSGDGACVRIWDALTGHPLLTLPHDKSAWNPKFSPDGNWLAVIQGGSRATSDKESVIKLWDLRPPVPKPPQ